MADDGACHVISPDLKLGSLIDSETDGQADASARGDNLDAQDDEDGLVSNPAWTSYGASLAVTVSVENSTGDVAYVSCWVDFDSSGTFDAGDEFASASSAVSGNVNLVWTTPAGLGSDPEFMRCRVSTFEADVQTPTGLAADGEVEDYAILIDPDACTDGVLNQDEAAIDCGGVCATCLTYGVHPESSKMKFGRGTSGLDFLSMRGGFEMASWDPDTCDFDLTISNVNGPVVAFSAPAGTTAKRGRTCSVLKDKAAKKTGGLQRLQICTMKTPGKMRFNLKGFDAFDALATEAEMTIGLTTCGTTFTRSTTWRQIREGWILPRSTWDP